ncbi:MAG: nicotinate-nucleotide adenylyltransferase [Cyanobacteria bacterium]|nr:nicotinate-nucleotide adenylyltransferase [Cyanobacteriota bacterium]
MSTSNEHKQLGVFCGTFNPIHIGHLLIAECARDQFKLDKVIFVTSPSPPHREDELLAGESRHKLVAAAIAENSAFEASSIELERDGPSYSVETVEAIRKQTGVATKLNLIIGGDNLSTLHTWHRVGDLVKLCRILVVPRLRYAQEGDGLKVVGDEPLAPVRQEYPEAEICPVDFPGIAISGSKVRERIRQGKTVLYMVPRCVNEIIVANGFYSTEGSLRV